MNFRQNSNSKLFRYIPTGLMLFGLFHPVPSNAQWNLFRSSNTQEKYIQGPRKDWSESEFRDYYRWRDQIYSLQRMTADDPQILRRQKAVLNGNKITTEIWNYGSISRPGNATTDIVWEGLGYGYEFGPFIGSLVEIAPRSHQDAYRKKDAQGNYIYHAMSAITDGAPYEPYSVTWGAGIRKDTDSGDLRINPASFDTLHGSNIYTVNEPTSDQAGFYVPINEIYDGDTLRIEWADDASTFAQLSADDVRIVDGILFVEYTILDGSLGDFFSTEANVRIHIFPAPREVWMARVISDGLVSLGGEVSPDGREFWGWEPLAYSDKGVPYADPDFSNIPTSNDIDRDGDGKPDSWAEGWYNPNLKEYVWPGALRQGASNADMESFFVVDDRKNKEFKYWPFPDDSTRRGLGLEIEFRYYQWSNPLAEDIIFLIYRVTNISDKDLNDVIFGMWGDPHVGGPNDWQDDLSFFDREINMVYCWDADGESDVSGRPPGYFGYKFLESPGQPYDGIDNDGDGMVDEAQDDNIDNDNDWDPEKHDVGIDGIPNTGDEGENDGQPTAGDRFDIRKPGEPNYEWTDLDESDMVGLTGFSAPVFGGQNNISNDDFVYKNFIQPGVFDSANANTAGDYIFIYSSGPINLPAGEARRFSIGLLVGENYDDLTLNAVTAQEIYEKNYQFAKPPDKPHVTAVPGDEKVTLYWDDVAETSIDPISQERDFEGYVIYRSTDPQFLDQQTITDAYGSKFLFRPLEMVTGAPARFDVINDYVGLSEIPYAGRGTYYNLGNNTGLVHSFVDSNNVINGQNYYYAVVAYDHGNDSLNIPPTETSKLITLNPENNEVFLDVNTINIIPRVQAAGYKPGTLVGGIQHIQGDASGTMEIEVINPLATEDQDTFEVTFTGNFSDGTQRYYVEDKLPITESYIADDEKFIALEKKHIDPESFVLSNLDGSTFFKPDTDFILEADNGKIMAIDSASGGSLVNGTEYNISYTYYPVWASDLLNMEEANPVFDGLKIYVKAKDLAVDNDRTGWNLTSPSNYRHSIGVYNQGGVAYPGDFEIRWSDAIVDTGEFGITAPFEIFEVTGGMIPKKWPFGIIDNPSNGTWDPGDDLVLFDEESGNTPTWQVTFTVPAGQSEIPPLEGDIFFLATSRPFYEDDVYRFVSRAAYVDEEQAKVDLDKIAVVPNPYVVTNVLEQLDRQNTRDRGPRRLYFNHLPKECTIRIYTITGELVDVLEHNSTIDDGKEFWDLTTRDNFPIAYGVYIYHVDAGELGEKIGRFGVIK